MQSIYLVGASDVASAGSQMARAASEMQQAAANIGGHLDQHNRELQNLLESHARAMDSFLDGMRTLVDKLVPPVLLQVEEQPDPVPERPPPAPGFKRCPACSEDVLVEDMPKHKEMCDEVPF